MSPAPAALEEIVGEATAAGGDRYAGLVVGAFSGSDTVVRGAGSTGADGPPPDRDTLFQIGSVTKVFTALALADAVVRQELALDTPLASYLPGVPTASTGARITLAHLATHTSGLPRLPRGLRRQALRHRLDPYRDFTTDDLVDALARARLRRPPGTKVRYSNFGAALLGEALSRHAGVSYEQLVRDRVTSPLQLADTVITLTADQAERKASGHSRRRRSVPDWNLGAMPGAGALYSTAGDLLAFLRAHAEPDLTPLPQAVRLVQEPRVTANRWLRVGLGWHLSPVRGTRHTAVWHNGGTGGHFSFVALVPDTRSAVVVLTNTARSVDRLGFRLLEQVARSAPARAAD